MKFQKETINNANREHDIEIRAFMRKRKQKCWTGNWSTQNLSSLQYINNIWITIFGGGTMTAMHFLEKYNKKRMSFKAIIQQ